MRQMGILAAYVWVRLLQKRSAAVMLYVMPLLLIMILGTALSGTVGKERPIAGTIKLALLMEDDGAFVSEFRHFAEKEASTSFELVSVETEEELRRRVGSGEFQLGLSVPAGFTRSVREGKAPVWHLTLGRDFIKNAIGEQEIGSFIDRFNHEAAINVLWPGEQPGAEYSPETVKVPKSPESDGGKSFTSLQYYAAHILVMFMLYGGMGAALELVEEKEKHTLMRLRSLPLLPYRLLAGKAAGQFAVVASQAVLIVAGTSLLYGVNWGGRPVMLSAVCLLVDVFTIALAAVIGMYARSSKTVLAIFQTLIMVMTFLSGGFSPVIGEFLFKLGHYTLNYWAVNALLDLMAGNGPAAIGLRLYVLAAAAAAMCLIAVLGFGRVGYRE